MSLRFALPLLTALAFLCSAAQAATYYVDPVNGRDTYNGTSATVSGSTGPWQTVGKVQAFSLQANDKVLFKSGSIFSDGLKITRSGSAPLGPITFGRYGSGNLPIFKKNSGNLVSGYASAIEVTGAYIVLDSLSGRDSHYCGVVLQPSANHVTVKNCYFTNVGIGIRCEYSSYNLIEYNTVENLHMVVNSSAPGGDYGANGAWLEGNSSHNDITNNKFINCEAASYDFGRDGGALEIGEYTAGNVCDDNVFAKNRIQNSNVVLEIGGTANTTVTNLTVAYNVCYKNGYFAVIHTENQTRLFDNVLIYNNTVVEPDAFQRYKFLITVDEGGFTNYNQVKLYNNIFYLGGNYQYLGYAENGIPSYNGTHYNNDYYRVNASFTQYGLANATVNGNIDANPLFVSFNPSLGFDSQNFRLQSGSPATSKGAYVAGGYTLN